MWKMAHMKHLLLSERNTRTSSLAFITAQMDMLVGIDKLRYASSSTTPDAFRELILAVLTNRTL